MCDTVTRIKAAGGRGGDDGAFGGALETTPGPNTPRIPTKKPRKRRRRAGGGQNQGQNEGQGKGRGRGGARSLKKKEIDFEKC